jgi:hypothetical protein
VDAPRCTIAGAVGRTRLQRFADKERAPTYQPLSEPLGGYSTTATPRTSIKMNWP